MKNGQITIIQGAQYGSEGKGQLAAVVAKRRSIGHAVRTGSINAGHTVLHEPSGRRFKMQIIPTAWVNPGTQLYLGPGTYIHEGIFQREINDIKEATGEDISSRLFIDYRCSVMGEAEQQIAKSYNRHHMMGATGKGCSEAVIHRLRARGKPDLWEVSLFRNSPLGKSGMVQIADVSAMLMNEYKDHGEEILIEGTQGALLDFNLGPWPFTTNRACNSAAWLAEAGLPSNLRQYIISVMRTYPIRVAGNSGPMPGEITWVQLGHQINRYMEDVGCLPMMNSAALDEYDAALESMRTLHFPECPNVKFETWTPEQRLEHRAALSEIPTLAFKSVSPEYLANLDWIERTTVTCKIRRIAALSLKDVADGNIWNNPDEMFVSFLNYEFPDMWNLESNGVGDYLDSIESVPIYLRHIQKVLGVPVGGFSSGPDPKHHHNITL